jgi:hypothetical protein
MLFFHFVQQQQNKDAFKLIKNNEHLTQAFKLCLDDDYVNKDKVYL